MTGVTLAAALVDRGLSPAERGAKQSLFDLVLSRFSELPPTGGSAVRAYWVPGRLEVFGMHTDYAGGRTLVAAVPRGFAVIARPRQDHVLHVVDARRDQDVTLPVAEAASLARSAQTGWRRYVETVARRLGRNFPGAALGADIVIASDLPRASGMSSSSALLVAIARALVRAGALDGRDEWRRDISSAEDEAGYYACIENGLSFGGLAGDSGVGTHGGSEDHAAILTGAPGRLSAFAFVPMRPIDVVAMPDAWRVVITPSGVPAQKTGTAREAYNRLSEGTRLLLTIWNSGRSHAAVSLADALNEASSEPLPSDLLRSMVRRSSVADWPADALERRLDHFIREDSRVPEAIEAFRQTDAATLGRIAAEAQADAETLLGNQIPETMTLASRARSLGAFASRSFGAGFGGSVWALVPADRAASFAPAWHSEAFIATPGPPLIELEGL